MVQREEVENLAGSPKPNNGDLSDKLKSGVESLSGMSMDHVKVHYNSSRPAQLNTPAYAQGSEIQVAPEYEHYVPYEAWHVVQQTIGRVTPTMQEKTTWSVNNHLGSETKAKVMGKEGDGQGA